MTVLLSFYAVYVIIIVAMVVLKKEECKLKGAVAKFLGRRCRGWATY